jgi:hypothetical protein
MSWIPPSLNCGDPALEQQPMWVLCSVFPELSDGGDVVEIVGCVTDIRYVILKVPLVPCSQGGEVVRSGARRCNPLELQMLRSLNGKQSIPVSPSPANFPQGNWKILSI